MEPRPSFPEPKPRTIEQTKKEKINSTDIKDADKAIHLSGMIYIPEITLKPGMIGRIGKMASEQPWFKELEKDTEFRSKDPMRKAMRDLYDAMGEKETQDMKKGESFNVEMGYRLIDYFFQYKQKNEGRDPEWLSFFDTDVRKCLVFEYETDCIHKKAPWLLSSPIPYAGINTYAMESEEMFSDLSETFNLWRLSRIKQLAYKRDPFPTEAGEKERYQNEFPHNRLTHSFDVLAVATLLGTNAGLSPEELKILQIAAVSHDFLTPAGGDTVKMIDPEAFDEDKNYNKIFETEEWKNFAIKYSISKEQEKKLYETVKGEGISGKLLDIADKTAYVARDIDVVLHWMVRYVGFVNEKNKKILYEDKNPGFPRIKKILKLDPLVCGVWDSVEIIDGRVVITNPERLARFLELRTYLFKELYHNPYSRFFLDKFIERMAGYLYKNKDLEEHLDENFFFENDDTSLDGRIGEFIGNDLFVNFSGLNSSEIKKCESLEEANKIAKKYNDDPNTIVIIDDWQIAASPSTRKFLVKKDGKVLPFNEAFPEEAKNIDGIMNSTKQIHVQIISLNDLQIPQSHRPKIKEIFRIAE